MSWKNDKTCILHWWPIILAGEKPDGYVFVETMENEALSIQNQEDWDNWVTHIENIWPHLDFIEPLYGKNLGQDELNTYLGPHINRYLFQKTDQHVTFQLPDFASKTHFSSDIYDLAEKIRQEFHLKEIVVSQSSHQDWIKKQLKEAYIGFSTLSTFLNIPKKQIGQNQLKLWFYEQSCYSGGICSSSEHIEIHQKGGNLAHIWNLWQMNQTFSSHDILSDYMLKWKHSWGKEKRSSLEYQLNFLDKENLLFKSLMESIPVTTDMGKKIFRRYRATCTWFDYLSKGCSLDSSYSTWEKLKTGNKITFSSENNLFPNLIQKWTHYESFIEHAFFKNLEWSMPSWILMYFYHQKIFSIQLNEEDCLALWSIGFESYIRQKVGYDSWLAIDHVLLPHGYELTQFSRFFESFLSFLFLKE